MVRRVPTWPHFHYSPGHRVYMKFYLIFRLYSVSWDPRTGCYPLTNLGELFYRLNDILDSIGPTAKTSPWQGALIKKIPQGLALGDKLLGPERR